MNKTERDILIKKTLETLEKNDPQLVIGMARVAVGAIVADYANTKDADAYINALCETFGLDESDSQTIATLRKSVSGNVDTILRKGKKRQPFYEFIGKITVWGSSITVIGLTCLLWAAKTDKLPKEKIANAAIELVLKDSNMTDEQKQISKKAISALLAGEGPMGALGSILTNIGLQPETVKTITHAIETIAATRDVDQVITGLQKDLDLTDADTQLLRTSFGEIFAGNGIKQTTELINEHITKGIDLATKPMQDDVRKIIGDKKDHAIKAAMQVFLGYDYDASTFRKIIIDSLQGRDLHTSAQEAFLEDPDIKQKHTTYIEEMLPTLSEEKRDLLATYFGTPDKQNKYQIAQLYYTLEKIEELQPKISKVMERYKAQKKYSQITLQTCNITLEQYVFYMGILHGVDPKKAFEQVQK